MGRMPPCTSVRTITSLNSSPSSGGGKPSPEVVVTMASPPQSTTRHPSHWQSVENYSTYFWERWEGASCSTLASDAVEIAWQQTGPRSFLAKFWRLTSFNTSYQNCLEFVILCSNRWPKVEVTARQKGVFLRCRIGQVWGHSWVECNRGFSSRAGRGADRIQGGRGWRLLRAAEHSVGPARSGELLFIPPCRALVCDALRSLSRLALVSSRYSAANI